MSETTVESGTTAPAAPAPRSPTNAPSVTVPFAVPAPEPIDDRRKDTIQDLRAEAAQYRIQAREAKERLAALEAEHATRMEAEKQAAAAAALAPLQKNFEKLKQQMLATKVESALAAAGLKDPDLVSMYHRCPEAGEVTIDEDFNVQGVEKMVTAFKAWKPDFFQGAGNTAQAAPAQAPAAAPQSFTAVPPRTSAGGEPPPSTGETTIDFRDKSKWDRKAVAAYKAEMFKKMRTTGSAGFGV